jgi:hypothetical protein
MTITATAPFGQPLGNARPTEKPSSSSTAATAAGGVVLTAFGRILIGWREHRRRIAQARRAAGAPSQP